MVHSVFTNFLLLFIVLINPLGVVLVVFGLNSDGQVLISLLNNWNAASDEIKSSWNASDSTPCNWTGIQCHFNRSVVFSLDLSYYQISGQLGPQIGKLRYLNELSLCKTNLSGTIPKELVNCSHLRHLDLALNNLVGKIPEYLFQIPHLKTIDLNSNNLSGVIPYSIDSSCVQLEFLSLSGNSLKGVIPLGLGNCSKLKELDLFGNYLTGEIPSCLSNCSCLKLLDLGANNLTGHIPSSFGLLTQIIYLYLSDNHLSGTIPIEILKKCGSLERLMLARNQLEGGIPVELGMLRKLRYLHLHHNQLEGEIPVQIGLLRNLQYLYLHENHLSGEIPVQITELHGLSILALSDNQLSGVIPETLGINTSLWYVCLTNNHFSGKIPPNLCYGKQLKVLNLGQNELHGNIPSNLTTTCHSLQILRLNENQLSGSIPPFPANNSLIHLSMNRNYIDGQFPRSLINCKGLRTLDLGNNQINDTFPIWLKSLPDLYFISLRLNRFQGPIVIQNMWRKKSTAHNMLKVIDISFNYFSGELPSELFSWLNVSMNYSQYKYASHEDEFPISYRATTSVIYKGREIRLNYTATTKFGLIDLSNNRFQGKIPESLGQLKLLNSLNLSNNNFNGLIPSSLGNMTQLESLDLSKNKLTGEIPLQLTKLSFLSILNLSENKLTGHIPTGGQFFTFKEDSFKGNLGLCGDQLSRKSCGHGDDQLNPSTAPRIEQRRNYSIFNQGFGWEPVMIGYSCGLLLVFFTHTIIFGWTYCKRKC